MLFEAEDTNFCKANFSSAHIIFLGHLSPLGTRLCLDDCQKVVSLFQQVFHLKRTFGNFAQDSQAAKLEKACGKDLEELLTANIDSIKQDTLTVWLMVTVVSCRGF